jgi:D-serine deaminase-like pyridoxal phosphate-dependent protein
MQKGWVSENRSTANRVFGSGHRKQLMATFCSVKLRAHVKTHKTAEIARIQLDDEGSGVCVGAIASTLPEVTLLFFITADGFLINLAANR